jgi:hypothetical protein
MSEAHDPAEAVGRVTHYFSHISVAAVQLDRALAVGERIHIRGHTTDLVQDVRSMEVEHAKVERAGPGDDVALQVEDHVRDHDLIFREALPRACPRTSVRRSPARALVTATLGRHGRCLPGPETRAAVGRAVGDAVSVDRWLDRLPLWRSSMSGCCRDSLTREMPLTGDSRRSTVCRGSPEREGSRVQAFGDAVSSDPDPERAIGHDGSMIQRPRLHGWRRREG